MTRYNFDLYPRTDPRDGSLIARLSDLQRAEYRGEANGAGVGLLSLRGDSSDGQLIDPSGLQYVRVVSDDTDKVVGGYFLDSGNFAAITKQNTRLLTFSGAGALSYLDREVMWSRSYILQHFAVFDDSTSQPFDGTWRLWNQGEAITDGDFLGACLWRAVWEAQHFDSAEDDDRPQSAIPDAVLTFDGFEDTDGNPWTLPSGQFEAQVGESLYQVTQRLMQAGLYVEMDPDTFELRAWEAEGHRRDRTGTAFGASVVRFSAGENIKSDAKRKIAAFIKRTAILASTTEDLAAVATAAGDIPWHGSIREDVDDVPALEQLAEAQLARRSDAADILRLRMRLGASPITGFYRPWEEVLPDDLVTVDSGSGQWDWDEAEFPVAALEIKLREEGDWDAFVELGASFSEGPGRGFQAPGVPHHHHGPNPMLCTALAPGTESLFRFYASDDTGAADPARHANWDDEVTGITKKLKTTADSSYPSTGTGASSSGGGSGGGVNQLYWAGMSDANIGSDLAAVLAAGGATVRGQFPARARSGVGISEVSQNMISNMSIRVAAGATTTVRGTALAPHTLSSSAGSTKWPAQSAHVNRQFPAAAAGHTLSAVAGTVSTDRLLLELGSRNYTLVTTGGALLLTSNAASDLPEDDATAKGPNGWIEIRGLTSAGGEGHHPDLVGTDATAARCDHRHHILSNRDPSTADDISQGFPITTLWTNTETGSSFVLLDEDTGEWQLFASPATGEVADHTHDANDITGLDDVALRWEAVTNGEDVFVWEDDDLVHEWAEY